jgi:hypothetical protein
MRSAWIKATAMMIRMVCTRKEAKRVPRRRAPTRRIMVEKIMAPAKKNAMETSDFSQPQGLLLG